uniref:Acid phosphatase n=1 Tax=Plectus sambesii TaxID=2011161 RepID=A0A914WSW4_9BILA
MVRSRCLVAVCSILLQCFYSVTSQNSRIDTLKFVHAVWRHGDRTPSRTFSTDTANNESTWPQGYGELTRKGITQQYDLGKWLRQRYDGFLSRSYSKYEIFVRSTGYNRTIMSAMATMAGLFVPEGEQIWNEDIRWQPIPVHSRPRESDPMLWTNRQCPTAEQLYREVVDMPEVKAIEGENAGFLSMLSEKTGSDRPLRLGDMWEIYDPLNAVYHHRETHEWPSWVSEEVWSDLQRLYHLYLKYYFFTTEVQRLRGGLLLSDVLTRMEQKVDGELDERRKFHAFSAHDTTLAALLVTLGILPERWPSYASVILVELHRRDDRNFVEVYFKNGTEDKVYPIEVSNCPRPCTLIQFSKRSKALIPTDWEYECGLKVWYELEPKTYLIMVGVLAVVITLLAAIVGSFVMTALRAEPVAIYELSSPMHPLSSRDTDEGGV